MQKRSAPVFLAVLALTTLLVGVGRAEDRVLEEGKWYPSMESGVTLTQSAYSDNWAGGDNGSIVWTFITNAGLESQLNSKLHWNNTLKLAYGQTSEQAVGEDGERQWSRPEKSTDLIDLESVVRFTLGGWVDPFASLRIESQFADASDPFGRTLGFNPIKIKESAGIAKQILDEEERSLLTRLGFAFRQSSRKFYEAAPPEESTFTESTNDGGLEWVTDYKNKILDDKVSWTSKLTFYQPVFFSGKDDLESFTAQELADLGLDSDIADFGTTLDVDWENIFTTQITEIISVQLYVRYIYDKYDNTVKPVLEDGTLTNPGVVGAAVRKAGQFKQTLAIGVTYRFL